MSTFPIRQRIPNEAHSLPKRPNRAIEHLPGPRAKWWLGHASRFTTDDASYIAEMTRTYGPVFKMPLPFGGRAVVMTGIAANRRVLERPEKIISNHNGYAQARLFGESIVTRDFEDHAELRRLIAPAFARPALRGYIDLINQLISQHLQPLLQQEQQNLEIFPAAKRIALDIAARAFAGMNLGVNQTKMNAALAAILEMTSVRLPIRIPGGVYDRGMRGRKFARAYFASEIASRRSGSANDFFSLLCRTENERGERLGGSEIIDNVIGAMIAGHDTTTVAISALSYEFSRHPEWQERVRRDCERALQESPTESLSHQSAASLDSVEWCAKEVLRLYSPVRYVQRRVVRGFDFEGHRIPTNATLLLSLHHTHHNPEYFESPEAFLPDRFGPAPPGRGLNSDAWAPFGKGPHVCLGMGFAMLEIKAFFAFLLPRYHLELPTPYPLEVKGLPVSMPQNGVPIRFTRIH